MTKRVQRKRRSTGTHFTWRLDANEITEARLPGLLAPRTAAQSIERGVARGQFRLILPHADAEPTSVAGNLVALTDQALEFQIVVRTRDAKRAHVTRLLVARNDRESADAVRDEIRNLKWLSERLPKNSVSVLATGTVFLADRHGRDSHHRRLAAYATKQLPNAVPLSFGTGEQFAAGAPSGKLLTRIETDRLRRRIIELCLRAFDASKNRAIPPPDLARGTWRLVGMASGKPDLVVTGCTTVWDRIDAVALIHRLTGFEWRFGKETLALLPTSEESLVEACVNALGKRAGLELLRSYCAALEGRRFPEHRRLPRPRVSSLLDER